MQSIAAMRVMNNDLPSIVYRQRNDYEGGNRNRIVKNIISMIIIALKARRLQGPHHGRHGVREEAEEPICATTGNVMRQRLVLPVRYGRTECVTAKIRFYH